MAYQPQDATRMKVKAVGDLVKMEAPSDGRELTKDIDIIYAMLESGESGIARPF